MPDECGAGNGVGNQFRTISPVTASYRFSPPDAISSRCNEIALST